MRTGRAGNWQQSSAASVNPSPSGRRISNRTMSGANAGTPLTIARASVHVCGEACVVSVKDEELNSGFRAVGVIIDNENGERSRLGHNGPCGVRGNARSRK